MENYTIDTISQDKLNVRNKRRSNIFTWRGQFTPDFVSYILEEYANSGELIADPFSGSGTVAMEALSRGMDCITYEINPSAFYMTSFYSYCRLDIEERRELIKEIVESVIPIIKTIRSNESVYLSNEKEYRIAFHSLLELAKRISASKLPDKYLPYIINVLFRCEKDRKITLRESVLKNFIGMKSLLLSLPESDNDFRPNLADARLMGDKNKNCIDVILSSPPYINVFNYHQNYRGIIECFDYDILRIAHSEIGSNRKNRTNRFRTVVEYAIEIGHVLNSCSEAMKSGAKLIFVVGRESMVRKTPFYNSKIITDLLSINPSYTLKDILVRQFRNRFGEEIYEDIIIAEKTGLTLGSEDDFKNIGLNHIESAIDYASKDVIDDLKDVVKNNQSIHESKIYTI